MSMGNRSSNRSASVIDGNLFTYNPTSSSSQHSLYKPLRSDRCEFRLLNFETSSRQEDGLHCSLHTFSLDQSPVFAALSYEWGRSIESFDICINGHNRKITRNLSSALKDFKLRQGRWSYERLEQSTPIAYIWADALCINQDDIAERDQQVSIMRQIYSEATVVISWLHESWSFRRNNSEVRGTHTSLAMAFQMFATLSKKVDLDAASMGNADQRLRMLVQWMDNPEADLAHAGIDPMDMTVWKAIARVCNHSYFTRLWVMQEMATAQRHVFWARGSMTVDGLAVHCFVEWLRVVETLEKISSSIPRNLQFALSQGIFYGHLNQWHDLMQTFRSCGSNQHKEFYESVGKSRRLQSTDPLDRVYALCSMPNAMRVDYARSVRDVYCALNREYMHHLDNPLDFLIDAGRGFIPSNPYNLPSWTPDYTQSLDHWQPSSITKACYCPDLRMSQKYNISEDGILTVSGCECDVVRRLERSMDPYHTIIAESFRDILNGYDTKTTKQYPTGILRTQALMRSLLFDYVGSVGERITVKTLQHEYRLLVVLRVILEPLGQEKAKVGNSTSADVIERLESCFSIEPQQGNRKWTGVDKDTLLNEVVQDDRLIKHIMNLKACFKAWRIFHTPMGYFGLGPAGSDVGDRICILPGCSMPVLLRSKGSHFEHIGPCFVLGYMDGEVGQQIKQGQLFQQDFVIH